MEQSAKKIIVYGTAWCGGSRRATQLLELEKIDFDWIDIDEDSKAAELVMSVNNGYRSVPTIFFPDGSRLIEPSSYELSEKLKSLQ